MNLWHGFESKVVSKQLFINSKTKKDEKSNSINRSRHGI